MAQVPYTDN